MDPDAIRQWRPHKFCEFIGAQNRPWITRLQRAAKARRPPSPLLLVAPYGYGKTSLARLLLKCLACNHRDAESGDPCNNCGHCRGADWGGMTPGSFEITEYNCGAMNREMVLTITSNHRWADRSAIFFDEMHRLNDEHAQTPLLKFVEDFPGVFIGAIMADRFDALIPPLRERFEAVLLKSPTHSEQAQLLADKSVEWKITAPFPLIAKMMHLSGRSFRMCLKVLAAAKENDGVLDEATLRLFFPSDGGA